VTQPIQFLFDECLGRPVVEGQIAESLKFYGADAIVAHIFAKFQPGTPDKIWISEIAREGNWIVITADRGIHSRMEEKLPLICREFNITHIMLSRGLHKRNIYYKALAIESSWSEIIATASAPPGTGFVLSMSENQTFRLKKIVDAKQADVPSSGYFFDKE
jgi:hypothetical protein